MTAARERLAVAQRLERLACERVGRGDERGGRVVGLAGRGREVPAVHEPVEHDEAGERLAVDVTEGRGDRAVERAGRGDRGREVAERGTERGERVGGVGRRGRGAAVRGGEHRGAADHVLQHAAHVEVGARRRAGRGRRA